MKTLHVVLAALLQQRYQSAMLFLTVLLLPMAEADAQCTTPSISITATDESMENCYDGQIHATIGGNAGDLYYFSLYLDGYNYTYIYIYGGTTETAYYLPAGSWQAFLYNTDGTCEVASNTVTISTPPCEPPLPVMNYYATPTDEYGCNGEITIVLGGSAEECNQVIIYDINGGGSESIAPAALGEGGGSYYSETICGGSTYTFTGIYSGTYELYQYNACGGCETFIGEVTVAGTCNLPELMVETTADETSPGTYDGELTFNMGGDPSAIFVVYLYRNGSSYTSFYMNGSSEYVYPYLTGGNYTTVVFSDCYACNTPGGSATINSGNCDMPSVSIIDHTDESYTGCYNGTLTVDLTGGDSNTYYLIQLFRGDYYYTYTYATGNSQFVLYNISAGIYHIEIYTQGGQCPELSNEVEVSSMGCGLHPLNDISYTDTDPTNCSGSITLALGGDPSVYNYIYLYRDGSYYTYNYLYGGDSYTFNYLPDGSYDIYQYNQCGVCQAHLGNVVLNAQGCNLPEMTISATDESGPGAYDGSITIGIGGDPANYYYVYVYRNGGYWSSTYLYGGSSYTYYNLTNGVYSLLYYTSCFSCETEGPSATINSSECNTPSVSIVSHTDISNFGCADGTLTIDVGGVNSGTYYLLYVDRNGVYYTYLYVYGNTQNLVSNLPEGDYSLRMYTAGGQCEQLGNSATILDAPCSLLPVNSLTATQIATNDCYGSITVSVGGDPSSYNYFELYKNGNYYTNSYSYGNNSAVFYYLDAGTYEVRQYNNCYYCQESTGTVVIDPYTCSLPSLTMAVTDESTPGASNGTLTLTIGGDPAHYYYIYLYKDGAHYTSLYMNGSTSYTFYYFTAGVYTTLYYTQCITCETTGPSGTIDSEPCNLPAFSITGHTDVSSKGCSDGTIDVSIGGSTGTYYYLRVYYDLANNYYYTYYVQGGTDYTLTGYSPGSFQVRLYETNYTCEQIGNTAEVGEPPCQLSVANWSVHYGTANANCSNGALAIRVNDVTSDYAYVEAYHNGDLVYNTSIWTNLDNQIIYNLPQGNIHLMVRSECQACLVETDATMSNGNWCPYDLSCSGLIEVNDLNMFLAEYGCTSNCDIGDFDGNGVVNSSDLLLFITQVHVYCPAPN